MRNELRDLATQAGLFIDSYSPGDGITRYRFFIRESDYFAGDGIFTALGLKEAMIFIRGYRLGRSQQIGSGGA